MSAKKLNVKRHASNAVITMAALAIVAACELLFITTLSDIVTLGPAVYSDYRPAQSPYSFPPLPTSNDQAPHAQANRAGLDLLAEVGQ